MSFLGKRLSENGLSLKGRHSREGGCRFSLLSTISAFDLTLSMLYLPVISAQAEIQNPLKLLDSRLHGNDAL